MGLSACSKHGWLAKAICHPLRGIQHLERTSINAREQARAAGQAFAAFYRNPLGQCVTWAALTGAGAALGGFSATTTGGIAVSACLLALYSRER